MGYMHNVRYILSLYLNDITNSRYVPPVDEWRLSQADINKDIPVDEMAMQIEPSMQLQIFETTLRLYVRRIGGEPFMRLEEMRSFKDRFFSVIASLRHGVVR